MRLGSPESRGTATHLSNQQHQAPQIHRRLWRPLELAVRQSLMALGPNLHGGRRCYRSRMHRRFQLAGLVRCRPSSRARGPARANSSIAWYYFRSRASPRHPCCRSAAEVTPPPPPPPPSMPAPPRAAVPPSPAPAPPRVVAPRALVLLATARVGTSPVGQRIVR